MTVYIKKLSLGGGDVMGQGPLKISTEHFTQSHFMKLQLRQGLLREDSEEQQLGGFFGSNTFIILKGSHPNTFIILKCSHQDLSNEESNFILNSLEVGRWPFFHKNKFWSLVTISE